MMTFLFVGLSKEQRQTLNRLRDLPEDAEEDMMTLQDILDGSVPLDLSHGGGEMENMEQELNEELNGKRQRYVLQCFFSLCCLTVIYRKRKDKRKRWDSVQRRVLGFRGQMKAITDSYIKWAANQGEFGLEEGVNSPDPEMIEKEYKVKVIDLFSTCAFLFACLPALKER